MDGTRRKYSDDDVIKAWPWFGGAPGKAARTIFGFWVALLVLLAVLTLYAFATLHICLGIGLFVVIVVVAVLPTMFLIGSRI